MTREDWKTRQANFGMVSSKALQDTINEYENKLCEMHSEILVLRSDKEALNKDIQDLKEKVKSEKRMSDNFYKSSKVTDKQIKILNLKIERLFKFIRSKWYLRRSICKEFYEDAKSIVRGW